MIISFASDRPFVLELSSLLVNMRSEAQVAVAGPLRTAVWNWIEFHRDEFNDSLLHRRLEGTPERVFDLLFQVDTNNKGAIWPALAILMCISSDRIRAEYNVNSLGIPKGTRRKVSTILVILPEVCVTEYPLFFRSVVS